jgi:uncharacterized protein (DUF736 family)
MAQIGAFTKTGRSGRIRTAAFDVHIVLFPIDKPDAANAPDYRIHLGDNDGVGGGPSVGAGCKCTRERAGDLSRRSLVVRALHSRSAPIYSRPKTMEWSSICCGVARRVATGLGDTCERRLVVQPLCLIESRSIPSPRSAPSRRWRVASVKSLSSDIDPRGDRRPALSLSP